MTAEDPAQRASGTLVLTACTVDLERNLVRGARSCALTTREAELLAYFVSRSGEIVTRNALLTDVYGHSSKTISRAVDNTVRRLRLKIELDPEQPEHLLTVHGVGYRFLAAPRVEELAIIPVRTKSRTIEFGEVVIDLDRGKIEGPSGTELLSGNDLALIETLWTLRSVDKATLARQVWGTTNPSRLPSAILRLRKKLEPDPASPVFLVTTPTGYALEIPTCPPLPVPPGPLFGRERPLATIETALCPQRWVLLVGPGGIGKSRLAYELCAKMGGTFVDASGVDTEEALAARIARAWNIPLRDSDPVDQVALVLSRRDGLLVLDDLDALVLEGALMRWVHAASRLCLLGTARHRTGLAGEVVIEIPPLDVDMGEQLFVHHARLAADTFRVRRDDRAVIHRLIERVDGMPLAIQLLAAHAAVAAPHDLIARLNLDLLARSGKDRHSSMRAIVQDSLDQLPAEEHSLLLYLAAFRSFDVEDAVAYAGPGALQTVQRLRDRSIIRELSRVPLRLCCWEVIRVHLGECRGATPQAELAQRAWLTRLARLGQPLALQRLDAGEDQAIFEALSASIDDLEEAIAVALRLGELSQAASCAAALAQRYRRTGPYLRGITLVRQVLAVDGIADAERCVLLDRASDLNFVLRFFQEAHDLATAALHSARRAADRYTEVRAHFMLGELERLAMFANPDAAVTHCEHARDIARELDLYGLASWGDLVIAEIRGDKPGIESAAREVLTSVSSGHTLAAWALFKLGERARRGYRWSEARHRLEALAHHPVVCNDRLLWFERLQQLVVLHLETGNGEHLDDALALALPAARDCGFLTEEGTFLCYHAASFLYRGDIAGAVSRIVLARSTFDRAPHEAEFLAYLDGHEGEIALWNGEPHVAQTLLLRAQRYYRSRSDTPQSIALLESTLGLVSLAMGRPDEALARSLAAIEMLSAHPRGQQAIAVARLGIVHAARGEWALAQADREQALALASAGAKLFPGTSVSHAIGEIDRALERRQWVPPPC